MRKKQVSSNESDMSSPRVELNKRRIMQDPELKVEHKYYEQVYEEQRGQFLDWKFDKKALDTFRCNCRVCQKCSERKVPPTPKSKSNGPTDKLYDADKNSDYALIIKRLVGPARQPKSLKILIPDTVIFSDGEPRAIIYSHKIKSIRQKEKLSLGQIRLQLNMRRKKQREFIDHFLSLELQKVSSKLLMNESEIMKTQSSQTKNTSNVKKLGVSKRGRSAAKSGEQIQQENLEVYFERNTREAIICKFNNGNSYIMNELEFLNLMMKRKNDEVWKSIQFIQNFIRPKKTTFEILNVKFSQAKLKNCLLFKRAIMESKVLNGDVLNTFQEYISPEDEIEFENALLLQNTSDFLRYQTYKIVHFLSIFDGCFVEKAVFQWAKNDLNEFEFVNAFGVQFHRDKIRYISTDEYFINLEVQAQDKLKLSPEMESKYYSQQKSRKVQELTDYMEGVYKAQKKVVGMDIDYFDVVEDETSHLVYQKLHPNANHSFQEIMHSDKIYNSMRSKLLGFGKRFSKMFDQFFYNPSKNYNSQTTNTPISTTILTRKDILGQSFSNSFATENYRNYLKSQQANSRVNETTPIGNRRLLKSAQPSKKNRLNRFNTEKRFMGDKVDDQRRLLKSEHEPRKNRQESSLETSPDAIQNFQTPKLKIKKNSLPYYLLLAHT